MIKFISTLSLLGLALGALLNSAAASAFRPQPSAPAPNVDLSDSQEEAPRRSLSIFSPFTGSPTDISKSWMGGDVPVKIVKRQPRPHIPIIRSKEQLREAQRLAEEGGKYLLVDCYATWCGPCLLLNPLLEAFAVKKKDQVIVVKIDVDASDELAAGLRVTALPTLLLFKGKELVVRKQGLSRNLMTAFAPYIK